MFLSNRNGNSIMTLFHQSLGALILAVLSLPAHAVYVAVHNQGHYSVRFEVNGRDSGFFETGLSRVMENASGAIRIYFNVGDLTCVTSQVVALEKWDLQVGKNNVDIFFQGNEFNPRLKLNGFDPVDFLNLLINLNDEYHLGGRGRCDWVKNSIP